MESVQNLLDEIRSAINKNELHKSIYEYLQ